ncbi:MAG: PQQ-dependent sugar dehydrogenase [Nonlabens sp.]
MKKLLLSLLFIIAVQLIQAQSVNLQPVGTGFQAPVDIKNAGDSRLFIVEQNGLIKILNSDGTVPSQPFLNISNLISTGGERGLLSMAFPQDYATSRAFYVNYTNVAGNTVIARYTVANASSNVANPNGDVVLTYTQPFPNHNGGCLQFGPDGLLYISSGDGGAGGDPGDRSQNVNTLLGKILRIDVSSFTAATPYTIPAGNPFASSPGSDEIFSTGLRNPWKFSFDGNNIWIADVGQNAFEEINSQPITSQNANYGWRCYEGGAPFDNTGNCPPDNQLVFPTATYSHSNSGNFKCSITGGYVYRGSRFPNFTGSYFFADFCSDEIGILPAGGNSGSITYPAHLNGAGFSSFGLDTTGELYVSARNTGTIFRVVDPTASIEEQDLQVAVYPNPASDRLHFRLSSDGFTQLKIFDLQGRLLETSSFTSREFSIGVTEYNSGQYIALIEQNHIKTTASIVIK